MLYKKEGTYSWIVYTNIFVVQDVIFILLESTWQDAEKLIEFICNKESPEGHTAFGFDTQRKE